MTAIKIHHTAIDMMGSWDGPAEEAKLSTPITGGVAQGMYAWYDDKAPDGDGDGWPDAKNAYKFPHHNVENGEPNAANMHGVDNALARLDQSDIPAGDKAAVKAHLEAHRKDAGMGDQAAGHAGAHRFHGNGQAKPRFWRFRDVAEGAEPEMELYGPISDESWWGDEVTPQLFKQDLQERGQGGPITIRVNSPGGDVVAASMIRAFIADYPGKVTARVDGLCASAATVVVMGADTVRMQDSAYMMIHDPVVGIMGYLDLEYLAQLIDELKTVKNSIVDVYEAKTGMSRDRLNKMMASETWMTASEAVAMGFADEVIGGKTASKSTMGMNAVAFANVLKNYVNVPAAVLAALQAEPVLTMSPEALRLQAEVKLLVP